MTNIDLVHDADDNGSGLSPQSLRLPNDGKCPQSTDRGAHMMFEDEAPPGESIVQPAAPLAAPSEIVLHPFQQDAIDAIRDEIAKGHRRVLLVAPTGSGKTIIASDVVARAIKKYSRVLLLAHRREIVDQTSEKLRRFDARHGIIMAGASPRPMEAVQVATIQTLSARAVRREVMGLPPADVVIIDEAHHCRADSYQEIIELYPKAVLLGLTATPCRGDGRGLGNVFEEMVECPQVAELIKLGHLVPSRIYAPVKPDLKNVRTQSGDYAVGQLERRMDTTELVGDVVRDFLQHGERRRTICFAVGVDHSKHIANEFLKFDIRAEHLDGNTPKDEREAILARLASGETEVVSNCMVLTEGFDCPDVGCIVLARPTKQLGLYRQMVGRGLRPAPGKKDCIILDHADAWRSHGRPEDDIAWTLDVDSRAANRSQEKRQRGDALQIFECPGCKVLMTRPPCPSCGWRPQPRARDVDFQDGELGLVQGALVRAGEMARAEQIRFYRELLGYARANGKQDGWAWHQCREGKGFEAPWSWKEQGHLPPTPATIAWAKHRIIRYAKSLQAKRGAA
jgi:superfamily II DNA or RNA helicase